MKYATVSTLLAVLAAAPSAMAQTFTSCSGFVDADGGVNFVSGVDADCELGDQNNDNPVSVVQGMFGISNWIREEKDDSPAAVISGTFTRASPGSCDAVMIVFKGGTGNAETSVFVGYLLDDPTTVSFGYQTPFRNANNQNLKAISHISVYCSPSEDTTTTTTTTTAPPPDTTTTTTTTTAPPPDTTTTTTTTTAPPPDTTQPPPPPGPGGDGDPHILTWSGKWFDYMGECDLAMLKAPKFDGRHDMNIDIRTTIQHDYSFIEAVALQIGEDVLEVGSYGDFAVNGVDTPYMGGKAGHIGGYPVVHTQVSKKKHTYDVVLSPTENITLASYKQLVSIHINVDEHKEKYFANSAGILGNVNGDLKSRKGQLMEGGDDFAEEWQVTDEEPMLFRVARAPQFPAKCNMPKPQSATGRRLGESIAEEAAKKACAHKTGVFFDNCVYDVMAVGDLELANAGAF